MGVSFVYFMRFLLFGLLFFNTSYSGVVDDFDGSIYSVREISEFLEKEQQILKVYTYLLDDFTKSGSKGKSTIQAHKFSGTLSGGAINVFSKIDLDIYLITTKPPSLSLL